MLIQNWFRPAISSLCSYCFQVRGWAWEWYKSIFEESKHTAGHQISKETNLHCLPNSMDEGVFVLNPHKLDDYGLEAWPPTAFYAPKQRPIVPLHGAPWDISTKNVKKLQSQMCESCRKAWFKTFAKQNRNIIGFTHTFGFEVCYCTK